jgi:HK97 family phage major capsid protein
MTKRQRPEKLGPLTRAFGLRAEEVQVDTAKRTARFSFSSEEPVDMWYGREILDHSSGSARLSGMRQQNMPLLYNHKRDDLLGVIENVAIENRKGQCDVRFGKDERGEWAMAQYADRILRNSSFLYRVYRWTEEPADHESGSPGYDPDQEPTYRVTDWEPFEISLVTIPADASVGAGRAADGEENPVLYVPRTTIVLPTRAPGPSTRGNAIMTTASTTGTGAASGGAPVINIDDVRREAAEQERQRVSDIMSIANRHGLGNGFFEKHRNSTVQVAQADALDEIARQRADADGIATRERERVREIEAIGKRFGLEDSFIRKHIDAKTDVATVKGIIIDQDLTNQRTVRPVSNAAAVDLTQREQQNYSLRRAILAALTGDWSGAGFEREVSGSIQKERGLQPRSQNSFFMPTNLPFQVKGAPRTRLITDRELMQRAMMYGERAPYAVGGATTGGNLVETQLLASDFIEVLRNRTVTGQLGARYLTGLVGNINIPRQNAQTSTYWVGESVALTESEATFDQVQLRPKVVGALSKMSRLTLQQTTPAIEMLVREDLLMVEALAVDLAAINGTGTSAQPTGVANTSGVGSVVGGTNGANFTFDHMIQLYSAPAVANAPQENLGFALNAKTRGYLATLKSTTGQYLWNPSGNVAAGIPDTLVSYRYAISNQLPSNLTKGTSSGVCSMAQYGNWQELLIGEWGVAEVVVNPFDSTGFANGDVLIRVFQTLDVGLRHPASFAVMSDGLTPGF